MTGPTDMIVPMLQRLQADVSHIKNIQAEQSVQLMEMKGYLTYNMGNTARNIADIEALRNELTELRTRVRALETRSE